MFVCSGVMGSLGSVAFCDAKSVGASGICFGVLGSLLALRYSMTSTSKHYIRKSVVSLLVLNLIVGFSTPWIDMSAHIFGFIGGYLISIFLGIKEHPHPKKMLGLVGYIITFVGLVLMCLVKT